MRVRLAAAVLSIALHFALALTLVHVTAKVPPPPPKHTAWNEDKDENAIHLRGAEASVDVKPLAETGLFAGQQTCPGKSYIGIGVVVGAGADVITLVGTNTPASRAGLRVGDLLIDADWSKREIEGSVLTFLVLRDGLQFPVTLTVARICND